MNKDNLPPRTTPHFAKLQRDTCIRGAEQGEFPAFSTDPDELEVCSSFGRTEKAQDTLSNGDWLLAPAHPPQWIDSIWHGRPFSWTRLPWLIAQWKRLRGGKAFVIKGIQSVEDARRAAGMEGVDGSCIVSNHAGRQIDGAIASLDALDAIVRSGAAGALTVMFDSGVRSGADVFKALALGAKLVFVGRPYVYAMSINGEHGVRHVMRSLLADFDPTMELAGYRSLDEVNREALVYQPGASLGAKL
ncbi:hypothetical protein JCM10207_003767 [Rhodosporidiobolus poonsookiae]